MTTWKLVAAGLAALLLTSCTAGQKSETATSTTAEVTTTVESADDMFAAILRGGGILATDEQLPSLRPLARTVCNTMETAQVPRSELYANTIQLLQALGEGKNIFDTERSTAAFVKASVFAYCPDYADLIP